MALPSIFDKTTVAQLNERLEQLRPDSPAHWGKMDAAQMLAHVNAVYAVSLGEKEARYPFLLRWLMRWLVKPSVVNEKPYKRNLRTAPAFKIGDAAAFEQEKQRLKGYLQRCLELGKVHFEGKKSPSFGEMTAEEWNNQFYKHLDHHFQQFGV